MTMIHIENNSFEETVNMAKKCVDAAFSHSLLFEQNANYLDFKHFVLVDTKHCDSPQKR